MSSDPLIIRAGPRAMAQLRRDGGLNSQQIKVMVGASGGPKWLILNRMDRVILDRWIVGRKTPIELIGSSIGAWRFACFGQADPIAAYDRFESGYLGFAFEKNPGREAVTRGTVEALEGLLGPTGIGEILANRSVRLNVMAVRSRGLTSSEKALPLATGLMMTATGNLLDRSTLGLFFERALFEHPFSQQGWATWEGFPKIEIPMTDKNLVPAIIATSSIPFVMEGIRDIADAPPGTYRDGGVIDYHFDVPFLSGAEEGYALYPHFGDRIVPGWFDKVLKWRRAGHRATDRMIMIAPAGPFIAGLPGGKIPSRKDFTRYSNRERLKIWHQVLAETQRLADRLADIIDKDRWMDVIQPFE